MKYYLVTTNHLENKVWFRDEDDFKMAMNAVAIYASLIGIRVIAFILMSNHVHFVLYCNRSDAEHFINEFKRHCSRYIRHKYGTKELLRKNEVDIQEIPNENESLEKVIAYVQMNCVAANICLHPTAYPWGPGKCFFCTETVKGQPLVNLPKAVRYRLIHSKLPVSKNLLIGPDGYILPESYIDVAEVEHLFRTAKRMQYFLNSSSKTKKKMETGETMGPAFRDQVIIAALGDICRTLFQKQDLSSLAQPELAELFRQIRFRFSSNVHQIARVTGFSYEEVTSLLDSL